MELIGICWTSLVPTRTLIWFLLIKDIHALCPRELTLIGRNIAYYMQRSGFEPRTPHFPIIKLCEL